MDQRYTEIFCLKEMLDNEGIDYEFNDNSVDSRMQHYQIAIYKDGNRLISVIQGYGTYGNEQDKLEIMGLLTEEEYQDDIVAGWLTAADVFNRIKCALYQPAHPLK